jgi:biotin transport system substrate-specific component
MALSPGSTLADYLVPSRPSRGINLLRDLLLVGGFSVFTALCAQVSFHIPITPVPITLQTLAVLLTGAALGSRRGALAMLLYLAEGAAGLPVFAGGTGGFVHLIGFTGGYLWSYPFAALVTGLLCERRLDRRFLTSALAMLPGTLVIYAFGVLWLAVSLHLNLLTAFMLGMVPFIPGDLIKLVIAAVLLPVAWSIVRWVRPGQFE